MADSGDANIRRAVKPPVTKKDSFGVLSAAGVLITAIISATNIYTTALQRDKELEIQREKNRSDQAIAHSQMILANIEKLNSSDASEKKLAVAAIVWTLKQDKADELFSIVQQFGPSEAQEAALSARATIATASAWEGTWKHSFRGRRGIFHGNMTLRSPEPGTITGEYEIQQGVKGSIRGTLTSDGSMLMGRWERSGQWGRFLFQIGKDERSLLGKYSMFDGDPQTQSGQEWNATKVSE